MRPRSLLGGLTVSCQRDDGRVTARAWRWPADVQIVVATPEAELETRARPPGAAGRRSRCVTPSSTCSARCCSSMRSQSGAHGDLREALRDRWHQPARAALVPGLAEALALEDDAILGACLSGAGPSIVVFTNGRAAEAQAR